MCYNRGNAGLSLLEVLIAAGVFALLIVALMGLMNNALSISETDILQTYTENVVQDAIDAVVADLKEASPTLCTFNSFLEDGRNQTVIVFPSARSQSYRFTYTIKKGAVDEVQSTPVWQCLRVYCYAADPAANRTDGWIFRYEDYNARSYANPITVASVTSTQITLSDGTSFSRQGALSANQRRVQLPGRFTQLVTQGDSPVQLTIQSECRQQEPALRGATVVTTLTNEVLSRNRN